MRSILKKTTKKTIDDEFVGTASSLRKQDKPSNNQIDGKNKSNSKSSVRSSSYELFDLLDESDHEEPLQDQPKNEKIDKPVDLVNNNPVDKNKIIESAKLAEASGWLQKFMKKDRKNIVMEEEILYGQSDDYIVKNFYNSYIDNDQQTAPEPEKVADNESDNDDGPTMQLDELYVDTLDYDDSTEFQQYSNIIQVYNLPYQATASNVSSLVEAACGLKVAKIVMGSSEIKGGNNGNKLMAVLNDSFTMPVGACALQFYLPNDHATNTSTCVQAIHGLKLNGRSLRAEAVKSNNSGNSLNSLKKRYSLTTANVNNSRYFDNSISCKCYLCNEVGHLANDCTNTTNTLICHLCGGTGHDAGNCNNIICYKCGEVGHHSKHCKGDFVPRNRFLRPVLCFQCGASNHSTNECIQYSAGYGRQGSNKVSSLLEHASSVCMICQKPGHNMCLKVRFKSLQTTAGESSLDDELYCPNCGEEGHHIGLHEGWQCVAPKYDAFLRFATLQKTLGTEDTDFEDSQGNGQGKQRRSRQDQLNELYRSLIRNPSDRGLFPSLNNNNGYRGNQHFQRDRDSRGFANNRNSFGGDRDRDSGRGGRHVEEPDEEQDKHQHSRRTSYPLKGGRDQRDHRERDREQTAGIDKRAMSTGRGLFSHINNDDRNSNSNNDTQHSSRAPSNFDRLKERDRDRDPKGKRESHGRKIMVDSPEQSDRKQRHRDVNDDEHDRHRSKEGSGKKRKRHDRDRDEEEEQPANASHHVNRDWEDKQAARKRRFS